MGVMKVKIVFDEEILGSLPNNEDIYREYIVSKSPDAKTIKEEVEALGVDFVEEKGMTIFPKTPDGQPFIYDYQIRGFFKAAFMALAKAGKDGYKGGENIAKEKSYKKLVDQQIFVEPREIMFKFDGLTGACVRPLRADTPQGPRVALAKSETVPAGAAIEFEILFLSPKIKACLVEALNYGRYNGLGQWRNSGKGTFHWAELDENGAIIDGNITA